MRILKFMLIAGLAGGGWHYWSKHEATASVAAASSPTGFVAVPAPVGIDPAQVLVIAPENCSSDAARRADDLAAELSGQHIPVSRVHAVNFELAGSDRATGERLLSIMNGELPIVFVGDWAKANPTLAEVLAEYRR